VVLCGLWRHDAAKVERMKSRKTILPRSDESATKVGAATLTPYPFGLGIWHEAGSVAEMPHSGGAHFGTVHRGGKVTLFNSANTGQSYGGALSSAVKGAARALDALAERSITAVDERVTLEQYRTLVLLATCGPLAVGALAEHSGVHASTMTRMCNRLVARGLITRSPSRLDRREVTIELSSFGSMFVDQVMTNYRRAIEAAAEDIDPTDCAAAMRALRSFAAAATGEDQTSRSIIKSA
jgi:DNA-binding MarR family transcriptional regulator